VRPLAEFIMRGRLQAAIVALVGGLFPLLISPAIVALVTLRKGAQEGTFVVMAGFVIPLLAYIVGDSGPLMSMASFLGLITVYVASMALRASRSWAYTLAVLIVASTLSVLIAIQMAPGPINALIQAFQETLDEIVKQSADTETPLANLELSMTTVSGFLVYTLLSSGLFALIIGRWGQAALYNPGGFGEEFRQLQLGSSMSIFCFVATAYCLTQGAGYQWWANVFALPLLIVATAIAHATAKAKSIGLPWMILFYIAMIGFSPILLVLVFVGFIDTWLNFRARLSVK